MARLSMQLLGTFQVALDGQSVTRAFRTEKERALLAYLVMESRRPVTREMLAEFFWPDRPPGKARTNLRQALAGLRKVLAEPPGGGTYLHVDDDSVQFNTASDYWLDVQAFRAALGATLRHDHQDLETCQVCAEQLETAIGHYRGQFFGDFYASTSLEFKEWLACQREQLFRYLLGAMKNLAAYYTNQGLTEQAIALTRQHTNLDPLDEYPRRQLMRLYALGGMRSLALEQYRVIQELLAEQLGVLPADETTRLYEQIKNGTLEHREKTVPRPTPVKSELTSFIDREAELERFKACVPNPVCRLLTVVGLPGVGKTRLAMKVAATYASRFEDGVWSVALSQVQTGEALAQAIAEAGQLPLNGYGNPKTGLIEALKPVNALLLLDGFEHLISQTGYLLQILHAAPGIKILVTSRERLDYQAACLFGLIGLEHPADINDPQAAGYPAVELFTNRAQHARARYQLSGDKLADIVRICQAVEGHPLAIELAAANLRKYSTAQLADELERSTRLLATTLQDVPEQHRNLRLLFDQVWLRLTPLEQSACRALTIYAEAFDLNTVAGRLASFDEPDELLAALVNKSVLLEVGAGKYHLPSLFRKYLLDRGTRPLTMDDEQLGIGSQAAGLYDELTGLVNTRLFWDRLRQTLRRVSRHGGGFALAMIDLSCAQRQFQLDETEQVTLLQFAATRLLDTLRLEDTLARLGAGEVGCILEDVADSGACNLVVQRIRRALDGEVDLGSRRINLAVRIGYQLYTGGAVDAESLVAQARKRILFSI
jgi:diguanylate cyclase (GGDEF)-like protein